MAKYGMLCKPPEGDPRADVMLGEEPERHVGHGWFWWGYAPNSRRHLEFSKEHLEREMAFYARNNDWKYQLIRTG